MSASKEPPVFPKHYRVFSADLSLRRPGFCVLDVDTASGAPVFSAFTHSLDMKSASATHGQILEAIKIQMSMLFRPLLLISESVPVFFVREKAFNSRAAMSEIGIFKVVGIADWLLEKTFPGHEWYELYPVSVKKLVTGLGKATKQQVAASLPNYLGPQIYHTDDESDAAAVAVAFLIQCGQLKTVPLLEANSDEVPQKAKNARSSEEKAAKSKTTRISAKKPAHKTIVAPSKEVVQ